MKLSLSSAEQVKAVAPKDRNGKTSYHTQTFTLTFDIEHWHLKHDRLGRKRRSKWVVNTSRGTDTMVIRITCKFCGHQHGCRAKAQLLPPWGTQKPEHENLPSPAVAVITVDNSGKWLAQRGSERGTIICYFQLAVSSHTQCGFLKWKGQQ